MKPFLHALILAGLMPCAVWAQSPKKLELKERLRIGSSERPNYSLTQVNSLAVAADGSVFVSQPMENCIRVYRRDGTFARQIGRKGSGPGEFRSIVRLTWTPQGLYVLDMATQRLTLVSAEGDVRRSWPRVKHFWGPMFMAEAPLAGLDSGLLITTPSYLLSGKDEVKRQPVSVVDSGGQYLSDLTRLDVVNAFKRVTDGKYTMNVPMPNAGSLLEFMPAENAILTVDHVVEGESAKFTIRKISTDGKVIMAKGYVLPAVPIVKAQIEKRIDYEATNLVKHRGKYFDLTRARLLFTSAFGDMTHQAVVDKVVVGRDGWFWLRRGSFESKQTNWMVFDPTGEMRGDVQLPSTVSPLYVERSGVWATVLDEDDVSFVVHYAIM